ncbi:phosphoglycerol transferase MdoB-like AlkP superfamily enzyme [Cerasibacillus quisquiliarum]|uniref:Uncharacterized protein n=1 Tax=Cerasibacillus quisquiliarum TaxID=227865 RepID=A0A511UY77_9BACI|nr:hypothetical protein [Cerasibacillus quisquiliarum]MBB5145026.1 phosphoglycerol transferase MdoB-like AlkP superfamily enzyme [Cerasibacillus quisquiliarum]GEN30082.1 hypothetical protein CQU01_03200 [Cerasibacillus quisquiliarum]
MKKIANWTHHLYSLIAFIALSVGAIVALLFIVSLIIGGNIGEGLAVRAGKLMNQAIYLAAMAMFFGLIHIYTAKRHTLTLKDE